MCGVIFGSIVINVRSIVIIFGSLVQSVRRGSRTEGKGREWNGREGKEKKREGKGRE